MHHRLSLPSNPSHRHPLAALFLCACLWALPVLGFAADAAAPDPSLATITPEQAKSWTEEPPAKRHSADQMWSFNKPDYHATVLLTQTEIGSVSLSAVIDKVLDQLDKQFALKPDKMERQFAAANCMGFKVVYQATNRGSARYQVQYFIPKNGYLYILTCSCKKGREEAINFDDFADAFTPPARK